MKNVTFITEERRAPDSARSGQALQRIITAWLVRELSGPHK